MKTMRYFEEQARRKRPYIDPARCAEAIAVPLRRGVQPDGRVRHWGDRAPQRENTPHILRVVL